MTLSNEKSFFIKIELIKVINLIAKLSFTISIWEILR